MSGYYARRPVWLVENLGIERIRAEAAQMERDAHRFYLAAAQRTSDADTRKLLGDLAAAEAGHEVAAEALEARHLDEGARCVEEADADHRQFVLTWVQPGLAGLMDGSVSTLAPIFATAFATQDTWTTFLVGLAASVGAGISMGFTEAASDDGQISGRGAPWKRGVASGVMTAVGGLGHALPYLIPHFWTATLIAMVVVFVELWAIAWIQNRYMDTPFLRAAFQVVLGGALVFAAGALIGQAMMYRKGEVCLFVRCRCPTGCRLEPAEALAAAERFRDYMARRHSVRHLPAATVPEAVIRRLRRRRRHRAVGRQPPALAFRRDPRSGDEGADPRRRRRRGARLLCRRRRRRMARRAGADRHRRPEAASDGRALADRGLRPALGQGRGRDALQELLRARERRASPPAF